MNKQNQNKLSSSVLKSLFKPPGKGAGSSASSITKLIEHYAYAEAIVASIDEPLVILDSSLRIKSANNAFFKLFKLPKKEAYGKSVFDFSVKKSEIPNLKRVLKDLLIKNVPVHGLELTHNFERAGPKTLLINAQRIVLDDYKTKLILLSIEDISERKIIETQKDDFVGFVTHELKTPLASLSMFIEILTGYHKKTKDKKSQYLLSKATTQIKRLTTLLNSFANAYKAQSGKLELYKEKVDINKLISEIIETYQYTQSTHSFIHEGHVEIPVTIDPERIHEVIVNLLNNAIKFSPNADKIILRIEENKNNVIVSVQDFGPGIPKDKKKKVFERFFRVTNENDRSITGLGLGLYIVSEIIKAHKGRLWVDSTVGKGSTFYFSIPKK